MVEGRSVALRQITIMLPGTTPRKRNAEASIETVSQPIAARALCVHVACGLHARLIKCNFATDQIRSDYTSQAKSVANTHQHGLPLNHVHPNPCNPIPLASWPVSTSTKAKARQIWRKQKLPPPCLTLLWLSPAWLLQLKVCNLSHFFKAAN